MRSSDRGQAELTPAALAARFRPLRLDDSPSNSSTEDIPSADDVRAKLSSVAPKAKIGSRREWLQAIPHRIPTASEPAATDLETNVTRLKPADEGEWDRPTLDSRQTSGDADVPRETVGQELCKERQRRGMELTDVWRILKIRFDYLVAIEEGRFHVLPGRLYAIGYVRSYAAYLGLDADALVDRMKVEMAGHDATEPVVSLAPPPESKPAPVRGGKLVAGLVAAVVIYSGYHFVASIGRTSEPPVRPVPERLVAEAGLAPKPVAEPPRAAIEQPPIVAVEPPRVAAVEPPPPAAVEPPPAIEQPTLPLPPEPALPPPREVAPIRTASVPAESGPKVQTPQPSSRRSFQNRNSRITLRVRRPTRVAVQGPRNRVFIDRTLAPGETYVVPNIDGVRLSALDAGAVEVILDGISVGFAGKDGGSTRGLLLTPKNVIISIRR